jgi:hypothetical protein
MRFSAIFDNVEVKDIGLKSLLKSVMFLALGTGGTSAMFAWLKKFASTAIISAPEYKIWSISGLYTVMYVDEELGNPFSLIELIR